MATPSDNYLDERDLHLSMGGYKGKDEVYHYSLGYKKRSGWDNEGLGAPTSHTRWSRQMGQCRSASHNIVLQNLSWRNSFIKGGKGAKSMGAECIQQCQNFPYTGFEDNQNTRWSIRKLGDFSPAQFKD